MSLPAKIVSAIFRHRKLGAVIIAFATLTMLFFASKARFSENVYDILPFSDSTISDHARAAEVFKFSNTLLFDIAPKNSTNLNDAIKATDALAKRLENIKQIERVDSGVDVNSFDIKSALDAIPHLFSESDVKTLEEKLAPENLETHIKRLIKQTRRMSGLSAKQNLSEDPAGTLEILLTKFKKLAPETQSEIFRGKIVSKNKSVLARAEGNFSPSDSARCNALMLEVEDAIAKTQNEFTNVKISCAGGYKIGAENAKIAKRDSLWCFTATTILMFLLCTGAFRRRTFAPLALLPSLSGSLFAFCLTFLVFGKVSSLAIAFASIAVGVGIDYAIHVLYRLDKPPRVSLASAEETASILAKPIAIVSATTSIAFAILMFSGVSGFVQLGFFGFVGICFAATTSVLLLPAFVAETKIPERKRIFDAVAEKILKVVKTKRCATLAIVALASAIATPFALNVKFEGELSALSALSKNAREDDKVIRQNWSSASNAKLATILAKDENTARVLNENLRDFFKNRTDCSAVGLWEILPSKSRANENFARWKNFWQQRANQFESSLKQIAKDEKIDSAIFNSAIARVKNIADTSLPTPPKFLTAGLCANSDKGYAIATRVVPQKNFDAEKFSAELKNAIPEAMYIDTKYLGEHVAKQSLNTLAKFALWAVVAVSIYLLIAFKFRIDIVLAILLPVSVGILWCLALMSIFAVKINAANLIFILFAVCVAQDYAVFTISSELKKRESKTAIASVLVSASTTLAAFGALAFAEHPMLKSLGLAAAISISAILISSLALAPVLGEYLAKTNPQKNWTGRTYGGRFGNACFLFLLRFGLFPAYVLLAFVAGYFILFRRDACLGCAKYLSKIFGKEISVFSPKTYIHNLTFGACLIERTAFLAGSKKVKLEDDCEDTIRKALERGRGVIVLVSHVGGWAMAATALEKYGVETGIVGANQERAEIDNMIKKHEKIKSPKFVAESSDTFAMLPALAILKRGGIVAMHADRYVSGKRAQIDFFADKIDAPLAPYILASVSGAELVQTICLREARAKYRAKAFSLGAVDRARGDELEQSVTSSAKLFFANLETTLKKYPYQWFNFYDFWKSPSSPDTKS